MPQCLCLNASGANKGKQCTNKSKPGSRWCGKHKNCKTTAADTKSKAAKVSTKSKAAKILKVKPYGTYGGAPTARVLFETYKKYGGVDDIEVAGQADYTGWWDDECRVLASRIGVPVLRRSPKSEKECDAHWDVTDYTPLTDQQLYDRGLLTKDQMREMQGLLANALQ